MKIANGRKVRRFGELPGRENLFTKWYWRRFRSFWGETRALRWPWTFAANFSFTM